MGGRCPEYQSRARGVSMPSTRPGRAGPSILSTSWSTYRSFVFFLHQCQKHVFQAGLAPAHFLHLCACLHQQTHEWAYLALAAQFQEEMAVVEVAMGALWPLSEPGQHLLGEATPHDLCLRAAGPGTQFIGGANRHEFALANHADLGTELFGLGQIVRVEEDRHSFPRNQAGQVITQSRRRYRIKPGSWLIQEDERRCV